MKISAIHIANLFDYASYQSFNETELRTLLTNRDLDLCNPQNTVSKSDFLNIYKTLINKVKQPYFGLYYGCFLNIKALGFITEISLNTSNIEQAVIILQAYLKNTFPIVSLSTKTNDNTYELQLHCSVENSHLKNHLLDTVYCFIYRELKLMLDNYFTITTILPYSKTTEYSELLNSEITSEKRHLIRLDKKVLETEINKKNVKKIELLLPNFIQILNNQNTKEFSSQVRNMILNMCTPEIPVFENVAKQFPLSNRTIQRKLMKEGQSYRKISNEIKKELSFYLTKGKQLKTQDIAHILGYSDSSAYLHAVKNWTLNSNS